LLVNAEIKVFLHIDILYLLRINVNTRGFKRYYFIYEIFQILFNFNTEVVSVFSVWSSPNPVLFGCGSSKTIGEQLVKNGCKKVIVIYDKGVKAAGIADKILKYINDAGIETVCYEDVQSDPPDWSINEAAALAIAQGVDGVVGVGGGSSMDTAKGVDVLLSNEPPINRYFARPSMPPAGDLTSLKPLIVIPTTSGTGSEVTPGGAVTDTENNTKENFVCPVTLGIIDPELTLSLPSSVTAATAFDALCHAIEAVVSNEPNKFSELFGSRAITLISKYLPVACRDGSNLEAREGLMLAATMASMSILGPYCNIPHDVGVVIGVMFHMPHGVAVSAVLPEAVEFVAQAVPDKVRLVAECLGADIPDGAGSEEIGRAAGRAIRKLMDDCGLPRIKSFVESREEFLSAVPMIMDTQNFHFSPRPVTATDITEMLSKAYSADLARPE
jgi:alcohol dehydrogenase